MAEFYTKLPIACPTCGSDDIPSLRCMVTETVETFEMFEQDPVKMLEQPDMSVYSRELHCYKCEQNFKCHVQIVL